MAPKHAYDTIDDGTNTTKNTNNNTTNNNNNNNNHHERSHLFISSRRIDDKYDSFDEEELLVVQKNSNEDNNNSNNTNSSPSSTKNEKAKRSIGSATVIETILNLAKTCMGTGCLVLPFAAQQGGLLLFIFGMILITLWNVFSSTRLCQSLEILEGTSTLLLQQQHHHPSDNDIIIDDDDENGNNHNNNNNNNVNNNMDANSQQQQQQQNQLLLLQKMPPPPTGTATLGKVAWYALGPNGLTIMDYMTILLLIGVLVAYLDAIRSFLVDTPFHTNSGWIDALLVAAIMASLSMVPDMGYLAKISAMGLSVLGFVLVVIAGYGIFNTTTAATTTTTLSSSSPFHLLPLNGITGISSWFGCSIFGFGIVPMTFNNQESMAKPKLYIHSATISLIGVAISYIIIGLGLLYLYPIVQGDILHEIPKLGILPIITRIALCFVNLVTGPLLIVPCAELTEGKFFHIDASTHTTTTNNNNHNPNTTTSENELTILNTKEEEEEEEEQIQTQQIQQQQKQIQIQEQQQQFNTKRMVRFGICILSAIISVAVPSFVNVLSFVGCFCVAFVSLVMPPILHLMLVLKTTMTFTTKNNTTTRSSSKNNKRRNISIIIDTFMILLGLGCVFITTIITFDELKTK